jgi:hypothetical protein
MAAGDALRRLAAGAFVLAGRVFMLTNDTHSY